MPVELKLIIASFQGTVSEWQEVIELLRMTDPRDRRLAKTILAGIERQKLRTVREIYGYQTMNERQKTLDEFSKNPHREYALRFRGGSIGRIEEIVDALENEAIYRAEGIENFEDDREISDHEWDLIREHELHQEKLT